MCRDWKLIEFYEYNKVELYNLKKDPGEKKDISDYYPEKKDELLHKLHKWQKKMGAKMPQANPEFKEW